ncbi:hypothetical protein ACTACV_27330 [Pseudomonas syringae]|uniref:Aspartyl protease n=1 Tax=Pseudomonas pergaminensis TaxID=2853159 RepID=A0ABD7TQ54_9PSED|nr:MULTISPECIES: hypothetical protein [Pseudomonas]OPB02759.1 hypothetical protein BFW91_26355 [Pseudomonas fluorescens]USW03717.1 hypothetical protein KUA23_13905 [Pseudomonas pergaminensis]
MSRENIKMSRLCKFLRFGFATAGFVLASSAIAEQAQRSVVPIREVLIEPSGTPRYSLTVTINGRPIEVGLDTGSVGLRILPAATLSAGVTQGVQPAIYSYGSGVQLDGTIAYTDIQIGTVKGKIAVQAVERVSCVAGKNCPAATLTAAQYGLMGSGQAGQGFQAIMGTRLNTGNVPNPLTAIGVHSWIVHLPQRGGSNGELILNPDQNDLAGFITLQRDTKTPGTVVACTMVDRPGALRFCGPTLLDTGAPGLAIRGAERPPGWQPGAQARITLMSSAGDENPSVVFLAGDKRNGAKTRFEPSKGNGVSVNAGTLPFYAYDVLFDQEHGEIAVRPNRFAQAVRPESR